MPTLIPQNQLDALPLLSVQDVTEGGTVQIVGGAVSRVYTNTQLGLTLAGPTESVPGNNQWYVATPYLDLRGCSNFLLAVTLTNVGIGPLVPAKQQFFLQHRDGPTDTPAAPDFNNSARYCCLAGPITGGYTYPSIPQGGSWTEWMSWSVADVTSDGTSVRMTNTGQNGRILILMQNNGAAISGQLKLTAWLEANS